MKIETTVKNIEEVIDLLDMFASKRKPLVKRKFAYKDSMKTTIHIVVGYDEVGRYTLNKGVEDVHFKDIQTINLIANSNMCFYMEVKGRELDFKVLGVTKHLKHLNRYKGLSKPSKKALEELRYKNESFISGGRDMLEAHGDKLPNKNGLMNQKVYLHVRDTCTNSMLMSQDFDILPKNLNQLINEVISMNPHLVRDLNIDYYEDKKEFSNGKVVKVATATLTKTHTYQYYTIKEALYASIVNNMSKSKDIEVAYKRESVAREYVEAFINLKESLGDAGFSNEDIERLMQKREVGTHNIKLVMSKIFIDDLGHFHRHKAKLFNYINHKLSMHAIKKDKENNRTIRNGNLQISIAWLEQKVFDMLNECRDMGVSTLIVVGVVASYIKSLDMVRRHAAPPKVFIKELMNGEDFVNELNKLVKSDPYKTDPVPDTVTSFLKV